MNDNITEAEKVHVDGLEKCITELEAERDRFRKICRALVRAADRNELYYSGWTSGLTSQALRIIKRARTAIND